MDEATHVLAFGVWDAPLTDDAAWLDAPPYTLTCMNCELHFRDGDNGCVYPTGWATHRECSLRMVQGGIGHHVNHDRFCEADGDPDAGLGRRLSSILVWRHTVEHVPVTEDEINALRSAMA